MPFSHFADRLTDAVKQKQTPLVVGIDPRANQLPADLLDDNTGMAERFAKFGMAVVDGVVDYAADKGLIVIMDAKRGDIGSTAQAYAAAYLGPKPESAWGCDCLTVNPYMGDDTLTPFVDAANRSGSGLFVLAKTSNPGSDWIQAKAENDQPIYHLVADEIQRLSANNLGESGYGNIGAVVGATYPEQLSELRERMPNTLFLIPGFGAQGGTASDVAGGLDEDGLGGLNQQDRYAKLKWQDAIRQAAVDTVERIADGTSASRLQS